MSYTYLPRFLDSGEATALFDALLDGVRWQQEWLHLYGRRVRVPRLVSWCGDAGVNYRYSGADHACDGWLPRLTALRRRIAEQTALQGNLLLVNRYRSGADYIGWHADDERGLAGRIASVSLGARRRFLLRLPGEQRSVSLDLEHGSLLVMDGGLRHTLPRTRKVVGERINLTFRRLMPPCR
jgi:alkylated DNA repair dioxygenase AlkB